MLDQFEQFLDATPFSPSAPGFHFLTVQAVDPSEAPIAEVDWRVSPATTTEVMAICREHGGDDLFFVATAAWDLWVFEVGKWQNLPHRMELSCAGQAFDDGVFTEQGHFQMDAGLEHLFTGHAGLLVRGGDSAAEHPDEAAFLRYMAEPAHLREYQEKTRENIARLLDFTQRIKAALPLERYELWSEGEEDFEARLDDILAAR